MGCDGLPKVRWKWNPLNGNSRLPKGSAAQESQLKVISQDRRPESPKKTSATLRAPSIPAHTRVERTETAQMSLLTLQALATHIGAHTQWSRCYTWHWPGLLGREVLRQMSWRCCYVCVWRLSHYHCLYFKIWFCNMEKCKRRLLIAHNSTLCMSAFYSAIIKHPGAF